ncbi:MAG: surface protein [Flavipsychrobacter sp.]|nr:surface protein [Flavipsychrobacter sp.]
MQMKRFTSVLLLLFVFFAKSFAIGAIQSDTVFCNGTKSVFIDTTLGGTWSSSNIKVGTIDPDGLFSALTAGTTTIVYTVGSNSVSQIVTVLQSPAIITGARDVCEAGTTVLIDTTANGKWFSSNPYIATIDSMKGDAMGVATGVAIITYKMPNGCYDTTDLTVHTLGGKVEGMNLCVGDWRVYEGTEPGGTWSMSNGTAATIDTFTGKATGIAIGEDTIIYTVTNICGTGVVRYPIYVHEAYSSYCWVSVPAVATQAGGLKIYPNPTQHSITVTSDELLPITAISVTNLTGRSVLAQDYNTVKAEVDVSNLPNGVYLIRINGTEVRKFIKQ